MAGVAPLSTRRYGRTERIGRIKYCAVVTRHYSDFVKAGFNPSLLSICAFCVLCGQPILSFSPRRRAAEDRSQHTAHNLSSNLTADRSRSARSQRAEQFPGFSLPSAAALRRCLPGFSLRRARFEHLVSRIAIDDLFVVTVQCRLLDDLLAFAGGQRRQLALRRIDQCALDRRRLPFVVKKRYKRLADAKLGDRRFHIDVLVLPKSLSRPP